MKLAKDDEGFNRAVHFLKSQAASPDVWCPLRAFAMTTGDFVIFAWRTQILKYLVGSGESTGSGAEQADRLGLILHATSCVDRILSRISPIPSSVAARLAGMQPRLYGYIRMFVFSPVDAEDLRQDVCEIVLRKESEFDTSRPFEPWVFGIARNRVLRHLKAARNRAVVLPAEIVEVLADESARDELWSTRFTFATLEECVSKLISKDRQLLELKFRDGLTGKEIASSVSWSEAKVSRALNRLYSQLMLCMRGMQRGRHG